MIPKIFLKNPYLNIALFLYTFVLLVIVVFRPGHGAVFEFSQGNFVPLKTIFEYLSGYYAWGTAMMNILGNIFIFTPVGLLLPLVFQTKAKKILWLLLLAYGIMPEILQAIFKSGVFDIDDIILNLLGVMLGYLLFVIFYRIVHQTNKRKKFLIPSIVLLILLLAGFGSWFFASRFITYPSNLYVDYSLPNATVIAFQTTLVNRALARGPHPIEGFDAFTLLNRFPGLAESDFNGVVSGAIHTEGMYSYINGTLTWKRVIRRSASSAERSVMHEGYGVLLHNLSMRLGLPVSNVDNVIELIETIDRAE